MKSKNYITIQSSMNPPENIPRQILTLDGQRACAEGKSMKSCPHKAESWRFYWMKGWSEANKVIKIHNAVNQKQ